jgi:hypothetical protein
MGELADGPWRSATELVVEGDYAESPACSERNLHVPRPMSQLAAFAG